MQVVGHLSEDQARSVGKSFTKPTNPRPCGALSLPLWFVVAHMVKYVIRGVALAGAGVLSFLLWTAFHIPNTEDIDIANALADEVMARDGHFLPRPEVDKTSQGRVLYPHPGPGGTPTFVIYEVTEPAERARIAALTRAALAQTHARQATLKFYERQNVTHFEGGGIRRGPERLLETDVVQPG